jgi:hypothetical protein
LTPSPSVSGSIGSSLAWSSPVLFRRSRSASSLPSLRPSPSRVRVLAHLVAVVDAVAIGVLVRVRHAVAVAVGLVRVRAREKLALVREAVLVGVLLRAVHVVALRPLVGDAVVVAVALLGARGGGERQHDERGGGHDENVEAAEDLSHDRSHRAPASPSLIVRALTGRPFDPDTLAA